MTARLSTGELAAVGGFIGKYNPTSWAQKYAITVVDGQRGLNYLPALHLPYIVAANAGFVIEAVREVGGFVVDGYPLRRTTDALLAAPRGLIRLAAGDPGPLSRAVLQVVEAAGVLA